MDLHIAGRKAIVCASSQGLGMACALSLSREGVKVFINGRTEDKLRATAEEISRADGQRGGAGRRGHHDGRWPREARRSVPRRRTSSSTTTPARARQVRRTGTTTRTSACSNRT